MNHDMSLTTRSSQFKALVDHCLATDKFGAIVELEHAIVALCHRLVELRNANQSLYIVGNGGSAGVAGHSATDFFNVAKIRASTLHESSLLTCMANDFGYENAFARMLSQMVKPGDIVIVISSSGKSVNIRNAAIQGAKNGGFVVTLSGFASDNPLRTLGDMNIWLDSNEYGFVEIGHQLSLIHI